MLVYYDPANGKILHTIDGSPKQPPPGDHIEVPDTTDLIPLSAFTVSGGAIVESDLGPAKQDAAAQVNAAVAKARLNYITSIPGQEMIYSDKEKEALAFLVADPEPSDLSDFPWIASEIGLTGDTGYEVAQVYANLAAFWRGVGPQLEHIRIKYVNSTAAATSMAELRAEVAACDAELAAFLSSAP